MVTGVERADNPCCADAKCTLWGGTELCKLRACKVRLDAWPERFDGGGENCYLENWGCQGSGFLIANNTLEWTRARGMMLKCCNGCIIGNRCKGGPLPSPPLPAASVFPRREDEGKERKDDIQYQPQRLKD